MAWAWLRQNNESVQLLDAVGETTTGEWKEVRGSIKSIYVLDTGSGNVTEVEVSPDKTTAYPLAGGSITATKAMTSIDSHQWWRAKVTTYNSGAISVQIET